MVQAAEDICIIARFIGDFFFGGSELSCWHLIILGVVENHFISFVNVEGEG